MFLEVTGVLSYCWESYLFAIRKVFCGLYHPLWLALCLCVLDHHTAVHSCEVDSKILQEI